MRAAQRCEVGNPQPSSGEEARWTIGFCPATMCAVQWREDKLDTEFIQLGVKRHR
jgi:hypothetical protein